MLLKVIGLFLKSSQHHVAPGDEPSPFDVTEIARIKQPITRAIGSGPLVRAEKGSHRLDDTAMNDESDNRNDGQHAYAEQSKTDLKLADWLNRLGAVDFCDHDPAEGRDHRGCSCNRDAAIITVVSQHICRLRPRQADGKRFDPGRENWLVDES